MMDWNGHDLGAGGWLLMGLVMLALWGSLIAVLVLVARQLTSRSPWIRSEPPPPVDPLQVLGERLARGDIDPEDYLRRRALLTGADRGVRSDTR